MSSQFTPKRVASLQPSATVILRAIGRLNRLVACTKWCVDVCPEIASMSCSVVSDSWTAQASQILASHPDLVIASVPYQLEAVAEILKAGIRFLGLAPKTLADIYTDIGTIAGVMGASEAGEGVIREMQREIQTTRDQVAAAGAQKRAPRVFCEEWGKPIIASQPWVAELVKAAGGDFVGIPGGRRSAEEVALDDPDVIVAAWCGAGDRVPLEKIVRDRNWGELRAVRSGRVYCIGDELLNTPAPTLMGGLRALSWAIHPDLLAQPQGVRAISPQPEPVNQTGL
ncbi:MAG TPA: ABC transporter substrate-binding protein [Terriglobales bacterium]|nr:ABC transporter substrate-binding protein [Terriglobales bacterium]